MLSLIISQREKSFLDFIPRLWALWWGTYKVHYCCQIDYKSNLKTLYWLLISFWAQRPIAVLQHSLENVFPLRSPLVSLEDHQGNHCPWCQSILPLPQNNINGETRKTFKIMTWILLNCLVIAAFFCKALAFSQTVTSNYWTFNWQLARICFLIVY